VVWDRSFGTDSADTLAALRLTGDGGFMAGGFAPGLRGNKTSRAYGGADYTAVRYDGAGNKLWDVTFGGDANDWLVDILPTADGGFLLAGNSYSGASGNKTSPGPFTLYPNYWVVKINAQGQKLWEGEYGGTGNDSLLDLAPWRPESYLLAGWSDSEAGPAKSSANRGQGPDYWLVGLGTAGSKLWEQTYGGESGEIMTRFLPLRDGTFLVGGDSSSKGGTGNKSAPLLAEFTIPRRHDVWVVRLDSDGGVVWDRSFNVDGDDTLLGIAPAVGSGAWVAGGRRARQRDLRLDHFGTRTFWVAQLDAVGTKLREFDMPNDPSSFFHSFLRASDGNLFVAGYTVPAGENQFLGKRLVVSTEFGWVYDYPGVMDYRIVKVGPAPVPSRAGAAELGTVTDMQSEVAQEGFLVSLVGEEGASYVTEWSADLVSWTPLATNTIATTEVRIRDLGATNAPMRFYRARQTE
jgi:hypothetical protein